MKKRINRNIYLFFAFMMAIVMNGSGARQAGGPQGTVRSGEYDIRWISVFPEVAEQTRAKKFFDRVGKLILGKRPAVLIKPVAILAHGSDEYWVLDQKKGSVVQVEKQKGSVLKLKFEDDEQLSSLVDLCEVPGVGILFVDSRINKIFVMQPGKKDVTVFNKSVDLQQPTGIAYSARKNEIWVLETKAHDVAVFDKDGNLIKKIGRRGKERGAFNYPTHIWIDNKTGLIYIVDSMNFRVQIFDSEGRWVSMFGEAGDATGYMARPKGIAVDSHGNIYVADALFQTVQIFDKEGHFLYNFGNQGRENGNFWLPMGVYIDGEDHIYVADMYNSRVQVFQLVNRKEK